VVGCYLGSQVEIFRCETKKKFINIFEPKDGVVQQKADNHVRIT